MKARPILFSGDMVRALLDGRKTQTRRAIKPQPPANLTNCGEAWNAGFVDVKCPYGQPGDLLWVRETWSVVFYGGHGGQSDSGKREVYQNFGVEYRAGGDAMDIELDRYDGHLMRLYDTQRGDWRPSIHMLRWASRLTLRITNVRVERLQEIIEADAIAEGLVSRRHVWRGCEYPLPNVGYLSRDGAEEIHSCPTQAFGDLWQSINGPDSWDANPWVWVIEFEVIPANVDAVLKETTNAA